jgi:hypothetical protein
LRWLDKKKRKAGGEIKRMVEINEMDREKNRGGRGNIGICGPNAKE